MTVIKIYEILFFVSNDIIIMRKNSREIILCKCKCLHIVTASGIRPEIRESERDHIVTSQ